MSSYIEYWKITASKDWDAVEHLFTIRKVILFGSYASDKQQEWSDIDVALVADEFTGVGFEDIKHFLDVTIQKPYLYIEPHTFNTSDFEKGNPFIAEIQRTGIVIV